MELFEDGGLGSSDGLIHQSTDVHADWSMGKDIGSAQIDVKPGNYTVVLYVEDNSDFATAMPTSVIQSGPLR